MRCSQIKGLLVVLALFFYVDADAQVIRTLLGNGALASSATDGNGGPAIYARMTIPYGVATDHKGNIYVSDNNYNVVRKIRPDGIIIRYAGVGGAPGYSGDGMVAINAALSSPMGLTCDAIGNLYIADAGNLVVRKVDTFGIITTFAGNHLVGSAGDGGQATAARIGPCSGITFDAAGNFYIANGNDRVRKVTPAGIISTVAGGTIGFSGNGGPATAAGMEGVADVAVDAAGNLYISEQVNNVIRKVSPSGIITAFCGTGTGGNTGDNGAATAARLNTPGGIKLDTAGNLYVCDVANNRVRRISPAGIITAYAGPTSPTSAGPAYGGDGLAATSTSVKFYYPTAISIDRAGHIYVTDKGPGFSGSGGGRRLRQIYKVDTFHVLANPGNSICAGDTVTFTAGITSSYYSFQYRWKVNGIAAGTNSPTFRTAAISTGDRISCTLTDTVISGSLLAISDTIVMTVNPLVTPSYSLSLTADTVCAGTHVIFNATSIVNGGSSPIVRWYVGGALSGTGTTFDYVPVNGDTVMGVLTSSEACVTSHTYSISKIITVRPLPDAGTLSGATLVCTGASAAYTSTGTTGGIWSATNSTASVSASGLVTGNTPGTDTISYTVTTATCGTATATRVVTVGATPNAGSIVGLTDVCPGSDITLTNAAPGGVWSVSNGRATITSAGVVTGVSGGLDTVSYTVTNSCGTAVATSVITVGVSSLQDAGVISGPSTVCTGSTISLSDTATGGFWASTHPSIATVDASGIVTGLLGGNDTIYYVVTSGCSPDTAFKAITVIPVLSAGTISGLSVICAGLSATLTDTFSGGAWSSDNSAVASIDASGHVATGIPGVANISYIVGNSCGSDTATHTITVNLQPFADTITGTMLLCSGSSATLTDTASGGVWSSSSPAIVTVTSSGYITGTASGTAVISYSVTNSCGSDIATHTVIVNPFPTLSSATTAPSICSGSLFNYTPTSTTPGAVFTWIRTAVAGISNPTASSTGDPNEILINTTNLPVSVVYTYAVSAGGCSTVDNVTVVVKAIPTLSSALAVTACSGTTFTYVPASLSAGATYAWTRATVGGVSPSGTSGTGAISENLVNGTAASIGVTYVFTITAAGCIGYKNLAVNVEPLGPPPPAITTKSPSWLCSNTMYQNFGTSSVPDTTVTYEWTASNAVVWAQGAGHQYSLVSFTNPGLAIVYLSSSVSGFSCRNTDSFGVFVGNNVSENPTLDYFEGAFIAQPGMSSYQWGYDDAITMDSTMLTGETEATYVNSSPDFANKYYWVITEHLLCMQKTYYRTPTAIGNVNANGIREVNIYPNPNKGTFSVNVSAETTEAAMLTLTNIVGAKVLQMPCTTNRKMELTLDQPAGIYLVTINTAHGKYVAKMTIAE